MDVLTLFDFCFIHGEGSIGSDRVTDKTRRHTHDLPLVVSVAVLFPCARPILFMCILLVVGQASMSLCSYIFSVGLCGFFPAFLLLCDFLPTLPVGFLQQLFSMLFLRACLLFHEHLGIYKAPHLFCVARPRPIVGWDWFCLASSHGVVLGGSTERKVSSLAVQIMIGRVRLEWVRCRV